MRQLRSSDGLLVVVAVAAAAATSGLIRGGPAEWLFLTVVALLLAVVVRVAVRAWRADRDERRRAADLAGTNPDEVAHAAVVEERQRLSADITARLRTLLQDVADEAAAYDGADDRAVVLRRIRRHAELATTELRRQLGLLRDPVLVTTPVAAPPRPWISRRDLLVAAVVVIVSLVEAVVHPRTEGWPRGWPSVLLTVLAAAPVVVRAAAPSLAAVTTGSIVLAGVVVGAPVIPGFWCFATIGAVLWTIAARPLAVRPALAAGFLIGTAGIGEWRTDPENAPFLGVVMAVAVLGGSVVHVFRRRAARAAAVARARGAQLGNHARPAVEAERHAYARDIHDVVSHAVGIVALQAAAADVILVRDPGGARAAVQVIDATVRSTSAALDALPGGPGPAGAPEDLETLVARIRRAGTPVDLTLIGAAPATVAEVVHRVVQETLTNVVRHGAGATARVRVHRLGPTVTVEVVDDGPGMPATGSGRGYGLVGLAERVEAAGGSLTIGTGPDGRGVGVRVRLPVEVDPVTVT